MSSPPSPTPPASRRFTDPHEPKTSIPEGLTIRGEIAGAESVELRGVLQGPLTTEGFCHVHESGSLQGRLVAGDVLVEGFVEGEIVARGKVELRAKARVKADIRAKTIAIADGCFFDGQIHMEGADAEVRFQERRKRS
jgi:cytoskeletal protein CcmA (bactofilin family)